MKPRQRRPVAVKDSRKLDPNHNFREWMAVAVKEEEEIQEVTEWCCRIADALQRNRVLMAWYVRKRK